MNVISPIEKSIFKAPSTGYRPVIGDTEKMYRVGNDLYIWDDTTQSYVAVGGGGSFPQAQYLTLATDATLTNERVMTMGENMSAVDGGAGGLYTVTGQIGAFAPNSITVTPGSRQDNYNPTGWNGTYPSKATTIFLNPTTHFVLGGLQGGTEGREVDLVNISEKLIIIEHLGTGSSAANRFRFGNAMAFFLLPGRQIKLKYNTTLNQWLAQNSMTFDYFDDFTADVNSSYASQSVVGLSAIHMSNGGTCGGTSLTGFNMTGVLALGSGTTTTTGNSKISFGARTGIQPGNANPQYLLSLQRFSLSAVPSVAENFTAIFGINGLGISNYIGNQGGAYWKIDRTLSTTNFYCTYGTTGAVTQQDTGVAFSTSVAYTVGSYVQNFTEACFFYTTDGITYTITNNIVGGCTTGASTSLIGIWKSAGTTARNIRADFMATISQSLR